MSIQVDNAELMSLLESSDVHTSSQVRELIQEQLSTGWTTGHLPSYTVTWKTRWFIANLLKNLY